MIHNSSKRKTFDSSNTGSEDDEESSRIFCFLRKVFKEELGDYRDHDSSKHMLLGLTIHAALLESGFMDTCPVSNYTPGNVQRNWYLPTFYYTLPDTITCGKTETVKIKFEHQGQRYCRVYGCSVGGNIMHSMLLDKTRLVLSSKGVWANCNRAIVVMKGSNKATKIQPEKEVLKFWREIKDKLVVPLLTDLYEKSRFMQLPDELMFKILESVSWHDLVSVSCVSSKLRWLASTDDLWKCQRIEQFPDIMCTNTTGWTYKEIFASFFTYC